MPVSFVDPWAGVGHDPADPLKSMPDSVRKPRPPRFAWLAEVSTCESRYRDGCGCNGASRCVLRFGGRVTTDDCRKCVESRRVPG